MALNVFFFSDDSMHKLFINYGKYIFTYNNQGGMLSNQILDGLRHKAILNYDIPDEIIGGIGGIVFYIDKDKFIKYL